MKWREGIVQTELTKTAKEWWYRSADSRSDCGLNGKEHTFGAAVSSRKVVGKELKQGSEESSKETRTEGTK